MENKITTTCRDNQDIDPDKTLSHDLIRRLSLLDLLYPRVFFYPSSPFLSRIFQSAPLVFL